MTKPNKGTSNTEVAELSDYTSDNDDDHDQLSAEFKIEDVDVAHHQLQSDSDSTHMKMNNPMKVDLVLETFFTFCPTNTLKNCRLVCKQWRDVSLKAWRSQAMLCLSKECKQGSTELDESLSLKDYFLHHCGNEEKPAHIPGNLTQLRKYPFRNFRIDSSILEYSHPNATPITDMALHVTLQDIRGSYNIFGKFLATFHFLESLELRNCEWSWKKSPLPLPLAQNLRRLKIYQDKGARNYVSDSEKFPFESFPNTKILCLEYRTTISCNDHAKCILKQLKRNKPFRLKELEIINFPSKLCNWNQRFDEKIFKIIVQCNLPLERLAFDFAFSGKMQINRAIRSIYPILNSCRDSIKYLRTSFHFDMDYFIDCAIPNYPQEWGWEMKIKRALKPVSSIKITLKKLKELRIANGLWGLYLLAHLELPNLEKLILEYGNCTKKVNIQQYQVLLLKERVYPKLETFELLNSYEIPGPETISLYANMMPNLIHLSAPLDKQSFQIVCQKLTGLKTLNILSAGCRYALLDDETLTGVIKEETVGITRRPNITDLVLLTDLRISKEVAFSDHSVIYGFLQLPKLYFLSVAFKNVSHEIKNKLGRHILGTLEVLEEEHYNLKYSENDVDIESEEDSCSGFTDDSFSSDES